MSEPPKVLQRVSVHPVAYAKDRQPVESGKFYVAPPDRHLLIKRDHMCLGFGPRENRMRPSVDVAFRTAAHAYASRVIGVVLSGSSNDGAAGAVSIKRHGGLLIAQDPAEALFQRMPVSAADYGPADYVLPVADIAKMLTNLTGSAKVEDDSDMSNIEDSAETGGAGLSYPPGAVPSGLTCPACGGAVWELQDVGLYQFKCHQGHSYTIELMLEEYDEQLETVSRVMARLLEEIFHLRKHMVDIAKEQGNESDAEELEQQAEQIKRQANVLHEFLYKSSGYFPKGL